jgi:two-component system, NtrC family, sensor kinase
MEEIRLILVDDEASFRDVMARRLSRRGIPAEVAAGASDCLAILKERPIDVVVSDVKMPGTDGLELLKQIKHRYPGTEVILLTGHANTADGVAGIKSGAFDYLTKPIELDHLIGKIHQAHEKIHREAEKAREAEFRRQMEAQMIVTERLASLGTLSTGVAHEINNPLAIIKESAGWMQLILQKAEMADIPRRADLEKGVGKIEEAVERARRITHQLLGFVQKDADSTLMETDLADLIEETVDLVNREASHRNIEMVRNVDPDARKIRTDSYQLRQVLVNLVTNAIHATGDGGRIEIQLTRKDDQVQLMVSDTGEGIPRENLKRIFEPFFSTKSPGKGTGLGLFVTRNIVEKLGGTIDVSSRVGAGTTFTIILPRRLPNGISESTLTDDPGGSGLIQRIMNAIR